MNKLMTEYDLFIKVREHLLKQNAKSMDKKGTACMYRGEEGRMCAVGCLITDENYTPEIEWTLVSSMLRTKNGRLAAALEKSGVPLTPLAIELMHELQSVHDHRQVKDWNNALNDIADKHFHEKNYAD